MTSPCKNICVLDAAGALCLGCGRTLGEIAAWSSASPAEQAAIAKAAAVRLSQLGQANPA